MFYTTQTILDALCPYCDINKADISTEQTDWKGRAYRSDYVTLVKEPYIGFEVFEDGAIIVSYFTDHCHFDNDCNDDKTDATYIQEAIEFLICLFTKPIQCQKTYKGDQLRWERYRFADDEENFSSVLCYYPGTWRHWFSKKHIKVVTWRYDKTYHHFTTYYSKDSSTCTIDVLDINETFYLEILEKNGIFSFCILHLEHDDYTDADVWTPWEDTGISFFDTKEKAIEAAKKRIADFSE